MSLEHAALESMRTHHPAWRLLRSDHAPLVASFLHRAFIVPNVRVIPASTLAEMLEDVLYGLRQQRGEGIFPRAAMEYLNDWAGPDKGWLRKFYIHGSDEAQFDLTPATEKAIAWLAGLSERSFVGTESRLLTLFELLRQMTEGTEADAGKRIAELKKRREEIDAEITRVAAGDVPLMDDTAVKDRFQQFTQLARELLMDFREVEHNFRQLDRRVRERVALWEGSKGALLKEIMGERDAIAESDQGRSFRAFWEFLMSSRRQDELTGMLERILALPTVADMQPDPRTRRVHYDWLEAGEHTQRTVALLSQQLRRFLDDQAWLESRRIMELLQGIESKALGLREEVPIESVMDIALPAAAIELPLERPLHSPTARPVIAEIELLADDEEFDASALFSQVVVDRALLSQHIREALRIRSQVTLRELIDQHPLQQGLAELIAYLQLGNESFQTVVDEDTPDVISWEAVTGDGIRQRKRARLPRMIFVSPQ